MNDLDDKLKTIGKKHGVSLVHYPSGVRCRCIDGPVDHFIVEVKKAFEEAGYERTVSANLSANPNEWYMKLDDWIKVAHNVKAQEGGFMTGKQWYDRFENELDKNLETRFVRGLVGQKALKAARKIASLKEES